jgi:[pyruvate, water dikinase]-phosphate phosphotransferase / [pyruvate, water dikinase] kinase
MLWEGTKINKEKDPVIYVISDSIGETAEYVAKAAAIQFNGGSIEVRRVPYVHEKVHLLSVLQEAAQLNRDNIIAYTLVIEDLSRYLEEEAAKLGLRTVDILGPMMNVLTDVTGLQPKMAPDLLHKLDEQYFRKVEAIEFAVKYDDGKDPRGVLHADIVLIGVSRTSKTPLSMYLAHKQIKAANIPLVPEVAPPEELFSVNSKKIIGLTIRPQLLNQIRTERLKALGLTANADYASFERILQELEYSESIMRRLGCTVIDVTNKAVEETASKVLEIYYKGERNV